MKILVINGPSMNMLGIREPELYGEGRLRDLEELIEKHCSGYGIDCEFYQSNHEGDLVDRIQQAYENTDGIIINAAAYSHTSIAILDALKAVNIPTVEVHMTDVSEREDFRKFSYVSLYAMKTVTGKGFTGYLEAVDELYEYLKKVEEAIRRVNAMEAIMDRVAEALNNGEKYEGMDENVEALEAYYAYNWKDDFELDEAGAFPKDMKRGILSEDGLYNLLDELGQ